MAILFIREYRMKPGDLQLITSGCNSAIYKLQDRHCEDALVLKTVSLVNKKEAGHLLNQYQFLSLLHHQNIITSLLFKPHVSFADVTTHMLVLEYANRGCLLDFIKKRTLTAEQCRFIFRQLAGAVHHLHSRNIAHRDLKLENVLVFQKDGKLLLKIADFGFADWTVVEGEDGQKLVKGVKGTKRGYMAPEIHVSLESKEGYRTKSADVFALGVMKLPFEYATKQNIIYKHIWADNFEAFWAHHSKDISRKTIQREDIRMDDLKRLLEGMLCRDPDSRYSMQEIVDHVWLQGDIRPPEP